MRCPPHAAAIATTTYLLRANPATPHDAERWSLYLESRRRGNLHPEIPAEDLSDDSPVIRDEMYDVARPMGEKQVRKLIHRLYFKAGLLRQSNEGRYSLCVRSLRKFFKTQLMALGVQSDYVEYMMGHTISIMISSRKACSFFATSTPTLGSESGQRALQRRRTNYQRWQEDSASPQRKHEIAVVRDAVTEGIKKRILAGQQLANPRVSLRWLGARWDSNAPPWLSSLLGDSLVV